MLQSPVRMTLLQPYSRDVWLKVIVCAQWLVARRHAVYDNRGSL